MPQAEHLKIIRAPFAQVWAFVANIDNWAPFVTGYQRHQALSDTDSIWFLKGELGGLTRVAEFKVHIDEWDDRGHVRFSLQGVNEPVTGTGSFDALRLDADARASELPAASAPARAGWFERWRAGIVRVVLARIFGNRRSPAEPAATAPGAPESGALTQVIFKLTLTAGGMAGMVLNALLTPMMQPVAEDLSDKLAVAIEGTPRAD